MTKDFLEKDMYAPVKQFFEAKGYTMRAEVTDIDATAVKGDELLLFEFKKSFNVTLLYQAIDRQKVSKRVYVVIPKQKKRVMGSIVHIASKLELGLITVNMVNKTVDVVLEPASGRVLNNVRSRRVLKEAASRKIDGNVGGSSGIKLLTAFRERSIKIACALYKHGEMTAKELKNLGCADDTSAILRNNFYNWFYKVSDKVYFLTDDGFNEIENGAFKEAVEYYLKEV